MNAIMMTDINIICLHTSNPLGSNKRMYRDYISPNYEPRETCKHGDCSLDTSVLRARGCFQQRCALVASFDIKNRDGQRDSWRKKV